MDILAVFFGCLFVIVGFLATTFGGSVVRTNFGW